MSSLPPLKALGVFEAVGRNLSVSKAAEELLLTASAVSQQIRALEEALGTRLFRRTHRRLVLTDSGARLLGYVASAMRLLRTGLDQLDQNRAATVLNVRSVPSFASKWLMPRLPSFLESNPDIDVHLDATPELTDFDRERFDLEIRHGDGSWAELFVEPLGQEEFRPVCSPLLLRRIGRSGIVEFLSRATLIHSVKSVVSWSEWLAQNDVVGVDTNRGLRFDRSHMSIQAAVDGLGVALESSALTQQEIESGILVAPFPWTRTLQAQPHWLVLPHAHLRRGRVQRFREWLQRQRQEEAPVLSG